MAFQHECLGRSADEIAVADASLLAADDVTHLRFTRDMLRAIVTQDVDCLRLAAAGDSDVFSMPRSIHRSAPD
jgi:hypothetical protein